MKTSGSLCQYYRDELALNNNEVFIDFPADNSNSISFKLKQQITGETGNNGTKDVEVIIPFWRTLEMSLINCENNLMLTWSKNCF